MDDEVDPLREDTAGFSEDSIDGGAVGDVAMPHHMASSTRRQRLDPLFQGISLVA